MPASPSRSRADSIASSSGDANEIASLPAHAALLPVFRKIGSAHSPSGLFTPLTDGGSASGSATPELQDNTIIDGKPEVQAADDQVSTPRQSADEVSVSASAMVVEPASEALVEDIEVPTDTLLDDQSSQYLYLGERVHRLTWDAVANEQVVEGSIPSVEAMESGAATGDTSKIISMPSPAPLVTTTEDVASVGPGRDKTPATDVDADAEGEVDSDYVPSEGEAVEPGSISEEKPMSPITAVDEDDPFLSRDNEGGLPPVEAGLKLKDDAVEPTAQLEGDSEQDAQIGVDGSLPTPTDRYVDITLCE